MIVADAATIVELLTDATGRADWAREQLVGRAPIHEPHLVDLEIVSAVRRLARQRRLSASDAEAALVTFVDLPIERHEHWRLLARVWALGSAVSAYDAVYVAVAEAFGVPFVTSDLRLARAARRYVDVIVP